MNDLLEVAQTDVAPTRLFGQGLKQPLDGDITPVIGYQSEFVRLPAEDIDQNFCKTVDAVAVFHRFGRDARGGGWFIAARPGAGWDHPA